MRKYFIPILFAILSGCATSEYGRGCRDALENAFTGGYTEWQGPFCDKLEAQYRAKQYPQRLIEGRGK